VTINPFILSYIFSFIFESLPDFFLFTSKVVNHRESFRFIIVRFEYFPFFFR
jgi:hypothetical protein